MIAVRAEQHVIWRQAPNPDEKPFEHEPAHCPVVITGDGIAMDQRPWASFKREAAFHTL
jgi:hypothetical protein